MEGMDLINDFYINTVNQYELVKTLEQIPQESTVFDEKLKKLLLLIEDRSYLLNQIESFKSFPVPKTLLDEIEYYESEKNRIFTNLLDEVKTNLTETQSKLKDINLAKQREVAYNPNLNVIDCEGTFFDKK